MRSGRKRTPGSEERPLHPSGAMASSNARVAPVRPQAEAPRPSVPRPDGGPRSVPPRPRSVAPSAPTASSAPVARKSEPVPKAAPPRSVPKPAPSGPRVRDAAKPAAEKSSDSESRVVAMRSVLPTLAGIGPDEIEAEAEALEEAPVSVAPPPPSFRSAEPTIIEAVPAPRVEARALQVETPALPLVHRVEAPLPLPLVTPAIAAPSIARAPAPVAPTFAAPSIPPVSAVVAKPAAPQPSLVDPMDHLFDAGYELCFLQTAVEGATHCLEAARRAVGARGALVHLVDVHTNELVTVAASEGAERQVLSRHEDDDWLMSAAVFRGKPMRMDYGGEVSSRPMPRHAIWDGLKNVLIVPVMGWGRALAVIEIVDVAEVFLSDDRAENALAYLAERFSQFLGEREIVLGFDSAS